MDLLVSELCFWELKSLLVYFLSMTHSSATFLKTNIGKQNLHNSYIMNSYFLMFKIFYFKAFLRLKGIILACKHLIKCYDNLFKSKDNVLIYTQMY